MQKIKYVECFAYEAQNSADKAQMIADELYQHNPGSRKSLEGVPLSIISYDIACLIRDYEQLRVRINQMLSKRRS